MQYMSISPTVSVIMPVYNCETTLSEAIDSIMNQTFQDFELIICDDCSNDCSKKIALDYANCYPQKIKVIANERNSKLHYSLNHCLKYAKGKYIARMDGDDISFPERLEKQVHFLEKHPDIPEVGSGYIRFDKNGDFGEVMSPKFHDKTQMTHGVPSCHACIMMKKEVYDKIGGYTVSKRTERCEDLDMWYKFYAAGFSGANLQEMLYKVRDSRVALKRRKLKYDWDAVKTNLIGFKMLHYPFYTYPLAFRQLISHFIPYRLKVKIRSNKAERMKDNGGREHNP